MQTARRNRQIQIRLKRIDIVVVFELLGSAGYQPFGHRLKFLDHGVGLALQLGQRIELVVSKARQRLEQLAALTLLTLFFI